MAKTPTGAKRPADLIGGIAPVAAIALLAGLLASTADADTIQNCDAAWSSMGPDAKGNMTREDFLAACQNAPMTAGAPAVKRPDDATAKCADGSYSMSPSAVDACTGHGGAVNDPHP